MRWATCLVFCACPICWHITHWSGANQKCLPCVIANKQVSIFVQYCFVDFFWHEIHYDNFCEQTTKNLSIECYYTVNIFQSNPLFFFFFSEILMTWLLCRGCVWPDAPSAERRVAGEVGVGGCMPCVHLYFDQHVLPLLLPHSTFRTQSWSALAGLGHDPPEYASSGKFWIWGRILCKAAGSGWLNYLWRRK